MSGARKWAYVAAMWALGFAVMAGFAWLVQWLDGHPVEVPAVVAVPEVDDADDALRALTLGAARSAASAVAFLETGERGQAMHAVTATLRAVEVGHETSHGVVEDAYTVALREVHFARQSIHLGNVAAAKRDLAEVVDRLTEVVEEAGVIDPGVPPEEVWDGYVGAVLLNANGVWVGEVAHIEAGGGGDTPQAVIHLGGAHDVMGIMDFGVTTARVPADVILWGPRRSIGSVLTALPSESSSVAAILEDVGQG